MQALLKYALFCFLYLSVPNTSWGAELEFFRDSSTKLSLPEVQSANISWQKTAYNKANFGFTNDALWLKVSLKNSSNNKVVKHLRINYPLLDHVDAYLVFNNTVQEHQYLSDQVPYNENRQHDKYYLFNYTLNAKSDYHVYIRVQTQSSMTVPIEVFQDAEYLQRKTYENYWFGALYGTLIIMGLYNLIIAITLRSLVYYLYVGYLSGFIFLISALNGHGFQYIWPQLPEFNNLTPIIGAVWSSLFVLPLAYYFLQVKKFAPRLAKVYQGLYLMVLMSIPGVLFLDYQASSQLMNGINLIFSPVILLTSINFAWHRRPGAKTFALAWLALIISLTLLSLSIYNLIPSSPYTRQAYPFGGLLELVIISFALARQINQSIIDKNYALKASETHLSKYLNMVTQSPAGIFSSDANGMIINCNPAFLRIMDIKENEINQFNFIKQLSKEKHEMSSLIEKIKNGESIIGLPMLCKTFNNQDKWLNLTLSQQNMPNGSGIEGQITDIHDQMVRQQEKEAHEQQRMASLQLLISGISHEINTPLGNNLTILSFIDDVYSGLNDDCENSSKEALSVLGSSFKLLNNNEQRIAQLIKRFSMVSTGYLNAEPAPINGNDLLKGLEIRYQEKLQGLIIHTHFSGPEIFISYKEPLIIILEALIDNSIKHGLPKVERPQIDIIMAIKDNGCELSYQDNGKGISEDIEDQIFQPFFTTSRGNEETSGLGLYAIDNIVKNLFQGSLTVQQSEQKDQTGFKLHIKLPNFKKAEYIETNEHNTIDLPRAYPI